MTNIISTADILNSLSKSIVVINQAGFIISFNTAWKDFGIENGMDPSIEWLAMNYFKVCENSIKIGSVQAEKQLIGLKRIISGEINQFSLEYECHSERVERWFISFAKAVYSTHDKMIHGVVISHINITEQKKLERELKVFTYVDSLTKVYNRRYFDDMFNEVVDKTRVYGQSFSLIMLDIDFFKKINDDYGHDMGDKALIRVAEVLLETLRVTDQCIRFGGDEFIVLLPNTKQNELVLLATEILKKIKNIELIAPEGTIKLTVSMGAMMVKGDMDSEQVLKEVDNALYIAKNKGRDQFCIKEDE